MGAFRYRKQGNRAMGESQQFGLRHSGPRTAGAWKRRNLSAAILLVLLCPVFQGTALSGVARIWAVGDGEKIDRDKIVSPLRFSNSHWDGTRVTLFAARNEVVAFQVIVEADPSGIQAVSLTLPEMVLRGGLNRLAYRSPAADPTNYADRPIQLFSENYMQVTRPTNAGWIYRQDSTAPSNPTGWKPVQLVPENARAGRGGFPLRVSPRQNQAFWIEIYTGRDRPAGVYDGTVRVVADGSELTVPVELRLYDFNLPERNSIDAMVYFESGQPLLYQGRRLDAEYHRFAHRNRIELVHAYDVGSLSGSVQRFLGGDFTPQEAYEGPGEGIGNRIAPATFYGPGTDYDNRESAWRKSDEWINFLDSTLPDYLTFVYMPDEPGFTEFPRIRTIADNIHSNPGPGQKLPIFVTHAYSAALAGAIDYWCTGPHTYNIQTALKEREKGNEYWIYNGGRPWAGAVVIDSPATDPRAIIWACFKHGIDLYFYWHSVHWQHNHQMKPGVDHNQDVWANPITFDNGESWANGDGVLIYPGQEVLHPAQDRGIPGPVSTIQLANFRRGLQDHLYLTLARQAGLDALVEEVLSETVPAVFSDTGTALGFSVGEAGFESARRRLGESIEQARELRRRR